MLRTRGNRHEAEVLSLLEGKYGAAIKPALLPVPLGAIDKSVANEERLRITMKAMRDGAPLIYQAYLEADHFSGCADFLVKGDRSPSGTWLYEPYDSKLSLEIKNTHIIQLCCYAELLEKLQGHRPKRAGVILGNQEIKYFSTDSYFYYYLNLKREFIEFQNGFDPAKPPFPRKGEEVRR